MENQVFQYAKAFARVLAPLPPREDGDDEEEVVDGDDVAATEQVYSKVQPPFSQLSSSMKICLYRHSTLQNALSPLQIYINI